MVHIVKNMMKMKLTGVSLPGRCHAHQVWPQAPEEWARSFFLQYQSDQNTHEKIQITNRGKHCLSCDFSWEPLIWSTSNIAGVWLRAQWHHTLNVHKTVIRTSWFYPQNKACFTGVSPILSNGWGIIKTFFSAVFHYKIILECCV